MTTAKLNKDDEVSKILIEDWSDGVSVEGDGVTTYHESLGDAFTDVSERFIDGGSEATIERADGFYACICFPGCLPETEWSGPYDSEDAAAEAMREMFGED